MENCSRDPEIGRPAELMDLRECKLVADFVISCYFATHKKAGSVSLDVLNELCSKFKINIDDEITITAT